MSTTNKQNNAGFTLVEILVTVVILGISMMTLGIMMQQFSQSRKNTSDLMDRRSQRMLGNVLIRRSMEDAWMSLTFAHLSVPVSNSVPTAIAAPDQAGMYLRNAQGLWQSLPANIQPQTKDGTVNTVQFFQDSWGQLTSVNTGANEVSTTFLPLEHFTEFDQANIYTVWPISDNLSEPLRLIRPSEPLLEFQVKKPVAAPSNTGCATQTEDLTLSMAGGIPENFNPDSLKNRILYIRNSNFPEQEFVFRKITLATSVPNSSTDLRVTTICSTPTSSDPVANFVFRTTSQSAGWDDGSTSILNWKYFSKKSTTPSNRYYTTQNPHSVNRVVFSADQDIYLATVIELETMTFQTTQGNTSKNLVIERYNGATTPTTIPLEKGIPLHTKVLFARKVFTDSIEVIIVE